MQLVSVYFGGGTPSLLDLENFKRIFSWIKEKYSLSDSCEISIEANPEELEISTLKAYLKLGINRISLGVQSFCDSELNILKRGHSAKEAIDAVYTCKKAGFQSISIDLMYELPRQSLKSWEKSLQIAVKLPISHVSLYNLVFEKHTAFFKERKTLKALVPNDETGRQMYDLALEYFHLNGLEQYEISAFAKAGFHSKHNIGYWTGRPFLGLGPASFSYWKKKRYKNIANLIRYRKALENGHHAIDFQERLNIEDQKKELLTLSLRLKSGICLKEFEQNFGKLSKDTLQSIEKLQALGLLVHNEHLALSQEGLRFYDSVASELI